MSKAYNFTQSGTGKYNIEANNLFHYVDDSSNAVPIYADAAAHETSLAGPLAVSRRSASPSLQKRYTYNGCSTTEQTGLKAAAPAAQTYAANALA